MNDVVIIGLGNPGEKYKKNRHNVGQRFVREANGEWQMANAKFLETETFMNESGEFVVKELGKLGGFGKFGGENLYIVHDDLDIPLGKYKIQFGKGPLVHHGVNSIETALGSKEFWRVRIGVDHRDPKNRTLGEDYVLQDFTPEELAILTNLFPKIWEELDAVVKNNSH